MKLSFDAQDLMRKAAALGASDRRLRWAGIKALTRTATDVRDAERREMADSFDRPTRWTLGAVYARPATPERPFAEVGISTDSGGQTPPIKWLRWQIYGGQRTPTPFERLLIRAGAMPDDMRSVPGRFAKLDAYGNMSRGQRIQILSHLRIDSTVGSTRSLPRPNRAHAAKTAHPSDRKAYTRQAGVVRRAYARAGGEYVAFPNGRGALRPGVYLMSRFERNDPKPVLIFVGRASYEAERFDFHYAADVAMRRSLPVQLRRAVDESLQSMFARGAARRAGQVPP